MTPPGRKLDTHSSKLSSSDSALERRPLIEISNKLHAMVDEFVYNMSSECGTLAHNISSEVGSLANNISPQGGSYTARESGPEPLATPRLSNRTTTEVLSGLRRPSGSPSTDPRHTDMKSQDSITRNREGGRFVRQLIQKKPKTTTLEEDNIQFDVHSLDISSERTMLRDEARNGRGTRDMAPRGKNRQSIEILSSDHSSDEGFRISMRHSRKIVGNQNTTKFRKSSSRVRPTEVHKKSPLRSPESSHLTDYGYEDDMHSPGGKSDPSSSPFIKRRWRKNVEHVPSFGTGKRSINDSEHGMNETSLKNDRPKLVDDVQLHEGDESNDEEIDGNENGESDGEEPPVLPKAPVKRKLTNESRGAERSSQRGNTKSGNPQTKKQRTPQIDASVIRQLQFEKRPPNCVSTLALASCV